MGRSTWILHVGSLADQATPYFSEDRPHYRFMWVYPVSEIAPSEVRPYYREVLGWHQGEWLLTDGRVVVWEFKRMHPPGSDREVHFPPERQFEPGTLDESEACRLINYEYLTLIGVAKSEASYFTVNGELPILDLLEWRLSGDSLEIYESPNRFQYESEQQFQEAWRAGFIAQADHKGFAQFAASLPALELDALVDAVKDTFQIGSVVGKQMRFDDLVVAFAVKLQSRNMGGEQVKVLAQKLRAALHVRQDDSTKEHEEPR